jgi:osmotically-inducible protein OsmY
LVRCSLPLGRSRRATVGHAAVVPKGGVEMDDKVIQEAVMRELDWDPKVDAAHIGVSVKNGAVTLTGHVSSYSEKLAAVKAAERVYGVKAVADEIKVRLPTSDVRDDTDIAEEIARELQWNTLVPDTVHAEVRNGIVTLRGDVEWAYQREEAERAVRDLTGVTGVTNLITVKPRVKAADIEQRIKEAIERAASLDARQIRVTTTNGTVHLQGHVHSLFEKKVAEEAAKAAPGIVKVENEIVVTP